MNHHVQAELRQIAGAQPYPMLFVTVSGAHLYGFASPDSDYDLRGVHVLPAAEVVGLNTPRETIEVSRPPDNDSLDLDLVTHDVRKFMAMMLKKNGYVLEQLYSPLVVQTTPEHEELKQIGRGCVTRHHVYHYKGFAETEWKLFAKENPPRVKPLLYIYRVLLTGIHLMRTGEIEANLLRLNESFRLPYIDDLVAIKVGGIEAQKLASVDMEFHRAEYERLRIELETAAEQSTLPETPSAKSALNGLLIRLRLNQPALG